jgi:SulP family sulfate permease
MSQTHSSRTILHRLFPFLSWLKGYRISFLQNDALAGLTVAVVLIPQAMAYAMLAGMPPVYGLYAAAVTPFIAALWGSLSQLATGPIAIMSLLVLTTLSPLAEPGSPQFVQLAFLLAFLVGILYLAVGFFRLGELMSFISHSAVKGFTSAAALIISATQLPHLLGITVSRHEFIFPMLMDIGKNLFNLHIFTFVIGAVAFGIIHGIKKFRPHFPAGLLALVVTTCGVWLFQLQDKGVAIIGEIPSGLPHFILPPLDYETGLSLLGPAIVIALVSFAETYSVGKAISAETKQKVNVDQEFIGQGLANLVGSFFQSYPVSGSFSRSAINFSAGAKTGISSVVSSLVVVLALLFLTPLLRYIPKAALAALVISAVLLLFHPREVLKLWRLNHHDGLVALAVFVLSLLTKPDYALLIGVMISLIYFLWRTMHPRIVRVTKDPAYNMFVNADVNDKPSCPQILHLRSDNIMYFANAEYTTDHMLERLSEQNTPVKFMLLDLQAVTYIDMTGIDALQALQEEIGAQKVQLALMGLHLPVVHVFETSGFYKKLNPDLLIEIRGDAVEILFKRLDHNYCKNTCPYVLFYECAFVK